MGDDTELEEGEAGTYQDGTIHHMDPDVDFAYIGEKLQDLLGHHQREFEGCFTAENLGPKFGAYGSFLPTVKRSPTSTLPVTPFVQVQNDLTKSEADSLGDSDSYAALSTTCQKAQHELGFTTDSKLPLVLPTVHDSASTDASSNLTKVSEVNTKAKASNLLPTMTPCNNNDLVKRDASVNSSVEKGKHSKTGDSEQLTKLAGRKPIRVRITMNSKKLLPLDNVSTIVGPGSSANLLESNIIKGKGVSLESQDIPANSPSAIIRSMTDSTMDGNSMMSPLPEYLAFLNINKSEYKDCSTSDNHLTGEDWSESNGKEKNLNHKKKKLHPIVCELPEESDWIPQFSMNGDQDIVNGRSDLDVCGKERPDFGTSQLIGPVNLKEKGTNTKCVGSTYRDSVADIARGPAKDDMHFADVTVNSKAMLHVQDAKKISSRVPEGRKISEGCSIQHVSLPRLSQGNQIVGSSVKTGNMPKASGLLNDFENINVRRGFEKKIFTYKDIFGDLSTDDEDTESVYCETSSNRLDKKSEMVSNKRVTVPMHNPKVKESCQRLGENVGISECTAVGSSVSVPVDRPYADVSAEAAPKAIQEDWVFCENSNCNKWRLLPFHIDPRSLPDKWTCRMLDWLPGMNSCEFSEDETADAVRALYEPIVLENLLRVDAGSHGTSSGVCPTEPPKRTFSSIVPAAMKKKNPGSTQMSKSIGVKPATKLQQRKPTDLVTDKNWSKVKMPKFFPNEGIKEKYPRTQKIREGHHCSSRVTDVLPQGNSKVEQDQSIDKDYMPHKHPVTQKNLLNVSAKRPNTKLQVSYDDSSMEMQTVDGFYVANNKRKIRESLESEPLSQVNQASHRSLSQDGQQRKKRMKLNQSGLNDFMPVECSGRPYEKVSTANGHTSAIGKGTNPSKLNMHNIHQRKKNLGSLGNIATESSSSKNYCSRKSKVELESVKISPVGSISSSPLYRPKKDKHTIRKKSSLRHDDQVDKSSYKKVEDELLQSADKSNTSCTISGSKEDVSSSQKRQDKQHSVLIKNAVSSRKRDNDANRSVEIDKCNVDEVIGDFFALEQPLSNDSNQAVEGSSHCSLLAENINLDSTSLTDNLLSGGVYSGHGDTKICSSQDAPESQLSIELHAVSTAATSDKIIKGPCQVMKGNQIETQLNCKAPQTTDGCRAKDFVDQNSSAIRMDPLNEAIFAEKEAKSLKYIADRFGESGSACEKVAVYFQSALKFLNAASLYESNTEFGERDCAIRIYRSTTKLLEFCGTEFEKLNNVCAAALAYKCMEVACMRVAYASSISGSKYLSELQTAVPPGVSPSSGFSDVDTLNNVAPGQQASSVKSVTVTSPFDTECLIISSQNRPNITQLFTFTEDVGMAMDSSAKSLNALATANANLANSEGISLVKKALDFSFQDVDEFILLVRSAMEATCGL